MANFLQVLLGVIVLTTGRKLYWLFVGVIGFIIGITLAQMIFTTESEVALLAIAFAAGVIGALLALFLQKAAVGVAGFLTGGYVLTELANTLDMRFGLSEWIIFLIGGIISAAMVAVLFDWALIILSSITGASILVGVFEIQGWLNFTVVFILFMIGMGIQTAAKRREHR